jgi:hypothetical protein
MVKAGAGPQNLTICEVHDFMLIAPLREGRHFDLRFEKDEALDEFFILLSPKAPFCTLIMALTENSKGIAPPAGLPSYSRISASPGTLWRGAGIEI